MELAYDTLLKRDKYRIISILGQGGFGITYLAEHVMSRRNVCIKEFFPKGYYRRGDDGKTLILSSDSFAESMDKFKAKFIKEAQTIVTLNHHNIIHIYDVFEENNTVYYVMEYIEGLSLSEVVKSQGALKEEVAVRYIRQITAALEYIHEQHVMHLDVKPGNVMLCKDNDHVILIDFGLSKHYDEQSGEATTSTPIGVSHGFAPIEQYQEGGVSRFSPETDIYSLGATLYYLVIGCVPPQAATLLNVKLELPANLSPQVRAAIACAMSPIANNRPHTANEFLELLDGVMAGDVVDIADDKTHMLSGYGDKAKFGTKPTFESQRIIETSSLEQKNRSKWWLWVLLLFIVAGAIVFFFITAGHGNDGRVSTNTDNSEAEPMVELPQDSIVGTQLITDGIAHVEGEQIVSDSLEQTNVKATETEPSPNTFNDTTNHPIPTTYIEKIGNISVKMIWVEGGTFHMGSNGGKRDEKPIHKVTLDGFWISETEVTQLLWEHIMGKSDSSLDSGAGDNYPMYGVSYDDASSFCVNISNVTGKQYTLPTEAQWEFAARGGNYSKKTKYSGSDDIEAVANSYANIIIGDNEAMPVKSKLPNELGIYDMSGNVSEWCKDWYGPYPNNAQNNPENKDHKSSLRINRGGNFNSREEQCSVFNRSYGNGTAKYYGCGVRIVRNQ